jgi:hypothetical protein
MTRLTLFARAAEALYPASSLALSQALKINQRTVQRWIAGAMWPPADVWGAMSRLLRVRSGECEALEREIEDLDERID